MEERTSELENEKMCENEVVCGYFEGMENVDRLCSWNSKMKQPTNSRYVPTKG